MRNPSYDNTEIFMTTTSELHSLGIRVPWDPGIPGHIHTFIHNDTGPAIGPFDIFDVTFDPWKNAKKRCWKFKKKNAVNFTPPKFNMEPKNEGLEDVFPF